MGIRHCSPFFSTSNTNTIERLRPQSRALNEADFASSLMGTDPGEIDAMLVEPSDAERANAA
jgi:hypothetical protein